MGKDRSGGDALDWQEMPGRKKTLVAEYLPGADVTSGEEWGSYLNWLLDRQTRLRQALTAGGGVPDVPPLPQPETAEPSSVRPVGEQHGGTEVTPT